MHGSPCFREHPLAAWMASGAVAVLYFVFGHAAFMTMVSHAIVTPVFFAPEGIALAAAILWGKRVAFGVIAGQLALALSRDLAFGPALMIALINGAEAVLAVSIARRWGLRPNLRSIADFGRLMGMIFFILQPFSATLGTATLWVFGVISESTDYSAAWLNWWMGNVMGQAQIAPLVLVALTTPGILTQSLRKVWLPMLLIFPAGWLTFQGVLSGGVAVVLVLFAPLLLWIADRGGLVPVTLASSLVSVVSLAMTGKGLGPFVERDGAHILDLNVFILGLALTAQFYALLAKDRAELQGRIEKIAAHIPGMIYQYQQWPDGRTTFPYASEGIQSIYGVSPRQVADDASPVFRALHPDDVPRIKQSIFRSASQMTAWNDQYRVNLPDGRVLWVEGESSPEQMSDGSILWHGYIHDVTDRKLAEEQMRITARIFDRAGEAIAVCDQTGLIQMVNPTFTRITGYSATEAIGNRISMLKSGRHSADFYQRMWSALRDKGFWQDEIWNRRKNGEIYAEWLTINRIDSPDGQTEHFVAVFSDITEIKDSQRRAQYLATHDALTGLPNRTLFQDRLTQAIARAARNETRLALLFIDLDNFKTINDTLGHDVGDALLLQAAMRLRKAVRDVDTVARLGGDEFTAILSDCDEQTAGQVARRILSDLSSAFELEGHTLFVSASIGAAFYPDDDNNPSGLIKAADAAMYRAKDQGRNRIEFFKATLQESLFRRVALEGALRETIKEKRLTLVYQPKFRIGEDHHLLGAEALLRWHDAHLGQVSPGEFIPVAETSGLIVELGHLVEDMLLKQMRDWLEEGLKIPPIAFNVSPRSVRESDFAQQLIRKANRAGVAKSLLQVEITEGALLESSEVVMANLAELDAAGIQIAIDDFGTGYSSLSYLKRLPIDELKIDRSFVAGLGSNREDEAIARAVLGLAQALGMKTVAEGVETDRQLAWLAQYGCHVAQGFLLSHPLRPDDFAARLRHV